MVDWHSTLYVPFELWVKKYSSRNIVHAHSCVNFIHLCCIPWPIKGGLAYHYFSSTIKHMSKVISHGFETACTVCMICQQQIISSSNTVYAHMICLLNNTINKAGPTGPSFVKLDDCSVVWSGATKKRQLAPDRAARLALGCTQWANIACQSLLAQRGRENDFITSIYERWHDMLNAPSCLSKLLAHSSDTHAYPTRHATRGLFTVPKSRRL